VFAFELVNVSPGKLPDDIDMVAPSDAEKVTDLLVFVSPDDTVVLAGNISGVFGIIVILWVFDLLIFVPEIAIEDVKLKVPLTEGVPVIAPVDAFIDRPAGSPSAV
jgi:hypothetical protein